MTVKNQFKITPPRTAAGRPTRTPPSTAAKTTMTSTSSAGVARKRVAIFHEYSGQRRQPEHDYSRCADDLPSHRHTARYRQQARSRLHGMVLGDDIRGLSSRM